MQGKNPLTLLAHILVPSPYPDPDPAGQGIGLNEWQLDGSNLAINTIVTDIATIFPPVRSKTLLLVTSGLVWAVAGQAQLQLFAARTAKVTRTGAVSQVTGTDESLIGPSVNLGVSGTTLPNQSWWLTPADLGQDQWPVGYLGVELRFPSAPTAGLVSAYGYLAAA